MFKVQNQLVFSPSDLTRYLEGPFVSWMARLVIESPDNAPERDPQDLLMQALANKGYAHEDDLEAEFLSQELSVTKIEGKNSEHKRARTLDAMQSGVDVIVQGRLELDNFGGYSDFLVRVDGASNLGDFHYEIWDTKLASKVKPAFLLQLCCYAEMLESIQGVKPEYLTVALGSGIKERFKTIDYFAFYKTLKHSFLEFQANWLIDQMPDPADSTAWGEWSTYANDCLLERDHLFQVATITNSQIKLLEQAGIQTMTALVSTDLTT